MYCLFCNQLNYQSGLSGFRYVLLMLSRYFTHRTMSSLVKKIINTPKAPQAIGPYSQAVLIDKTLYISGQLGMDPVSGNLVDGGAAVQAKKALENMGHILDAAGLKYESVVKTTVLLADMNDFASVNEVYTQFFKDNYPARAAYQVAALPKGGKVEIEAIAVVGNISYL